MKKILTIIGGIVVGVIVLVALLLLFVFNTSEKLVCESPEGDITIYYTEKELTGYKTNGMSYDLDGQKKYADEIGVENYLEEFKVWFSTNTTGSCK